MKKNIKMFLPVLMVASCVYMSSNVIADTQETTEVTSIEQTEEVSEEVEAISEEVMSEEQVEETLEEVVLNEQAQVILDDVKLLPLGDTLAFPVRQVAEALGYEVEWNGETKTISLTNLPSYITFSIGKDGYTFARTAPMPLGQAPVIIEGTTYAPIALLELINSEDSAYEVNVLNNENDNFLVISQKETLVEEIIEETTEEVDAEEVATFSEVEIISFDTENNYMLVKDANLGEVALNLDSENLVINKSKDFEIGQTIFVSYGEAMTMSIPPINNPLQISDTLENN